MGAAIASLLNVLDMEGEKSVFLGEELHETRNITQRKKIHQIYSPQKSFLKSAQRMDLKIIYTQI